MIPRHPNQTALIRQTVDDPNSDTDIDTCVRESAVCSVSTRRSQRRNSRRLVTDLEGNGPYYVAQAEFSPTLIGAEGYYSPEIYDELGDMNVIGAYD